MSDVLRFGILGAAWIAPTALIKPARKLREVRVEAIAARDSQRAAEFARKHQIPRVHTSYEQLLADPEIDAIYIPLPNSLHAAWSQRALEAGKHVLCEKPLAANAAEAERLAEVAARSGHVLAEAMHWRYHPLAARIRELMDERLVGQLRRIEIFNCFPIFRGSDIRYRYDLAGGAMMDLGCYAVSLLRLLAGAEPQTTSATARCYGERIDRWMSAELRFDSGCTARLTCSIWSKDFLRSDARVEGDRGELRIGNPFAPQLFHSLKWKTDQGAGKQQLKGCEGTFDYQLRAFVAAARGGPPVLTGPAEAVANMRIIDAIYLKAGLPVRGS